MPLCVVSPVESIEPELAFKPSLTIFTFELECLFHLHGMLVAGRLDLDLPLCCWFCLLCFGSLVPAFFGVKTIFLEFPNFPTGFPAGCLCICCLSVVAPEIGIIHYPQSMEN